MRIGGALLDLLCQLNGDGGFTARDAGAPAQATLLAKQTADSTGIHRIEILV